MSLAKIFAQLSIVCLLFSSCNEKLTESDESSSNDHSIVYSAYELNSHVKVHETAQSIIRKRIFYDYQTGFEIIEGEEYFSENRIQLSVNKTDESIDFNLLVNVSDYIKDKPMAYNEGFREEVEADRIIFRLYVKNENGKVVSRLEEKSLISGGKSSAYLSLTPSNYHFFSEGMKNVSIYIDTEFISIFDDESNIHPVVAELKLPFLVPKVYKSTLHFKSLVLNKEQTIAFLGDNDWNNPAPETGLIVTYGGTVVLNEYKKNSFSLKGNFKRNIFHLSEKDLLKIKIVDVDYGFNGNDLITDTLISIESLHSEDFLELPMPFVDEFLIRTTFDGIVN